MKGWHWILLGVIVALVSGAFIYFVMSGNKKSARDKQLADARETRITKGLESKINLNSNGHQKENAEQSITDTGEAGTGGQG